MVRFAVVLLLGLALRLAAERGAVLTTDGRRLEGDVQFTNDALIVTSSSSRVVVPATNIARAQLSTNVMAAQTKGSGNGLLGVYYTTINLSGTALTRLDQTIDFHWLKEPVPGVPADNFSVRWMGYLEAPTTDAYTLHFGSDDGGRVYLDGQLVADHTGPHPYEETNVVVNFRAGERRKLMLELLDFSGPARAQFSWSTASRPKALVPSDRLYAASFDREHRGDSSDLAGSHGLLGTYYENSDFTGNSFTRIDPEIDFDWKRQSPAPGIPTNDFSVRWTGNVFVTNSGEYRFWVMCSAPIRLYVNNELLTNPSIVFLMNSVVAKLQAGEPCELRLEMRRTNNIVPVRLFWSGPGFERTILARHHLSPGFAPSREAPAGHGEPLPAGVVLVSGTIAGAPIKSGTATTVRLGGALENQSISVTKLARIHVRPITTEMAAAIPKGRSGVLLKNRDFIDGEFAGVENGRVKIESVLFGSRSFDLAKEVIAVILRATEPPRWHYAVTARDGTALYGAGLKMEPSAVRFAEAPDVLLPAAEVIEITRRE